MSEHVSMPVCSSSDTADEEGVASAGSKRGGGSEIPSTTDADSSSQTANTMAAKTRRVTVADSVSCSTANLSFRKESNKFHLLIGCTGSVAAMKLPELIGEVRGACPISQDQVDVRVVATEKASRFFDADSLQIPVFTDADEWSSWRGRGDMILHIELRRWADVLVISPLDANTMAKIANGLCDNLLTCVVRAWDPKKPLYFCPAMNTFMWEHPLTYKQMDVLKNLLGFKEIPCVEKELMCGDRGYGAMASVPMIASVIASEIKNHFAIYTG